MSKLICINHLHVPLQQWCLIFWSSTSTLTCDYVIHWNLMSLPSDMIPLKKHNLKFVLLTVIFIVCASFDVQVIWLLWRHQFLLWFLICIDLLVIFSNIIAIIIAIVYDQWFFFAQLIWIKHIVHIVFDHIITFSLYLEFSSLNNDRVAAAIHHRRSL